MMGEGYRYGRETLLLSYGHLCCILMKTYPILQDNVRVSDYEAMAADGLEVPEGSVVRADSGHHHDGMTARDKSCATTKPGI